MLSLGSIQGILNTTILYVLQLQNHDLAVHATTSVDEGMIDYSFLTVFLQFLPIWFWCCAHVSFCDQIQRCVLLQEITVTFMLCKALQITSHLITAIVFIPAYI